MPLGTSWGRQVVILVTERAQRDAKASPRKPKVLSEAMSAYVDSFDV